MEATLVVVLEEFGRCSDEFLAIASAWEEICVPTGLPTDENGFVTCAYDFTLPSTVCEEADYLRVCLDNPISGLYYTWTVIGRQSSQFVMNGSQSGNSTTGLNLSCLELYTFPNYPYYPQVIMIEVYSPTLGSSFIVKRRTQIVDCNHDDPTCDEYYDSQEYAILPNNILDSDNEELSYSHPADINLTYEDMPRIDVFNILGHLLFSGTLAEYTEFRHSYSHEGPQIIFTVLYDQSNTIVNVEKSILMRR